MATPIPFSKAFKVGGYDDRPIMTLASPQLPRQNPYMRKTSNKVQSYGLPDGEINKTTLGAYRMGDSDTSSGAIYPNTTHAPNPPMERKIMPVSFAQVGNNVYQPALKDEALHALLTKHGDQKFKSIENDKYARYFQEERLKKDIAEVERTAGVTELTAAREIMRNFFAERRQQNEADYLRRLIDAGLSADDANDEIENVRRARAIQEAKTADTRPYQHKLLITRLANARGLLSKVNEPISSGAIMSPQPNQQIASALGTPEIGFGSTPLDLAYQFKTPEYYRRFLRRSNLTQEAADRDTALNNLIAEGKQGENIAYPEILRGMERQAAIEQQRIVLAQRIELLRKGTRKITDPLPTPLFAKNLIEKQIYEPLKVEAGEEVSYKFSDVFDLNIKELLLAYNTFIYQNPSNVLEVKRKLQDLNSEADLRAQLAQRLYELNDNNILVFVPVLKTLSTVSGKDVLKEINGFKSEPRSETEAKVELVKKAISVRKTRKATRSSREMKIDLPEANVEDKPITETGTQIPDDTVLDGYNKEELIQLSKQLSLAISGNKDVLKARIKAKRDEK